MSSESRFSHFKMVATDICRPKPDPTLQDGGIDMRLSRPDPYISSHISRQGQGSYPRDPPPSLQQKYYRNSIIGTLYRLKRDVHYYKGIKCNANGSLVTFTMYFLHSWKTKNMFMYIKSVKIRKTKRWPTGHTVRISKVFWTKY